MIKGDKIKLIRPMGAFKNIGEICEIINVAEGGVISFRFGGVHLGCMSYDEYKKYFEKVEYTEKKDWSKWSEQEIWFYDINNDKICEVVKYRNNGKKIQVRCGSLKSESTCGKSDSFDFSKGFDLAIKRLIVKYFDYQVKELALEM